MKFIKKCSPHQTIIFQVVKKNSVKKNTFQLWMFLILYSNSGYMVSATPISVNWKTGKQSANLHFVCSFHLFHLRKAWTHLFLASPLRGKTRKNSEFLTVQKAIANHSSILTRKPCQFTDNKEKGIWEAIIAHVLNGQGIKNSKISQPELDDLLCCPHLKTCTWLVRSKMDVLIQLQVECCFLG